MAGPLEGVRIVDLTRVLAGPFATMILGDLGAEVIKIEAVEGGDETRSIPPMRGGESHYFLSVNRNKKSVAVNLKTVEGQSIVKRLISGSDVLIENFRPGVAARLGIDPAAAHAANPRLVYCSISAFGQSGPWSDRTAFDVVVQALSGSMSINGQPEGPPLRSGVPIADLSAGMYAAMGVLGALVEVGRGKGPRVLDISMLDSTISLLGYVAQSTLMTGAEAQRFGNGHPSIVPYGAYRCADGHVVIAVLTERFWPKLCAAINAPELAADARFSSNVQRLDYRKAIDDAIEAHLSDLTVDECCSRLREHDVPHAPILGVSDALDLQPIRGRDGVIRVDHLTLGAVDILAPVFRYLGDAQPDVLPPPTLGQHNAEVLGELGYSQEQVQDLVTRGVLSGKPVVVP